MICKLWSKNKANKTFLNIVLLLLHKNNFSAYLIHLEWLSSKSLSRRCHSTNMLFLSEGIQISSHGTKTE